MADEIAPTQYQIPVNQATYNALPDYYTGTAQDFSGFIQDYLAKMQEPGGFVEGYQGPQVAGLDPYQTQAYTGATDATGVANPYLQTGADWQTQGADWLGQANQYLDTAPKNMFDTGAGMISDSYGGLSQAQQYLDTGSNVLGEASNLARASAIYDPNQVQTHLNPYLSGVIEEISRLGNENLFENIMPNVNSTFVGSGQFGSTRNGDFLNNAIRNTQREVLGQQANTLKGAWDSASGDYLNWSKLGLDSSGALTNIGNSYNNYGSTAIDKSIAGANMGTSTANVGNLMTDLGRTLGDFASTRSGMGKDFGQYGINAADYAWGDLNSLYGMGTQMQNYNQGVLDNGYQDWMNRWTQPAALAGALSEMIPRYTGALKPDTFSADTSSAGGDNNYEDLFAILSMLDDI